MAGIRYSVNSPQGQEDLKILSDAVVLMKQLPKTDPHSWAYQAAIHGVTNDPSNSELLKQPFVNSCPHWGQAGNETPWHFLIWHRYYLHYFEEAVRAVTKREDFNLPYWNTLDATQRNLPKEFRDQASGGLAGLVDETRKQGLNDGSLKITENRNQNGEITDNNGPTFDKASEQLESFRNSFVPFSSSLESVPHNITHSLIGGRNGNMGDTQKAGLDPIFWVHHANIDRLWTEICNDRITAAEAKTLQAGMNYGFYDRDKKPVTYSYEQAAQGLYKLDTTYDTINNTPNQNNTAKPIKDPPTFIQPKPFYSQATNAPISSLRNSDILFNKTLDLRSKPKAKTVLTIKTTICHDLGGSVDVFLGDMIVKGKDTFPNQNQSLRTLAALDGGKFLERYYLGSIALFGSAMKESTTKGNVSSQKSDAKGTAGHAASHCDITTKKEFIFDISSEITKALNQANVRDVIHFNIDPSQSSAKDLSSIIIHSISLSQIPI